MKCSTPYQSFPIAAVGAVYILFATPAFSEPNLDLSVQGECRFAGEFVQQKVIPGLTQELGSRGQFVFDCEAGVIWNTYQPIVEAQVFTFAGKHYQMDVDDSVEMLKGRAQTYMGELMLSLIRGDKARIAEDFALTVNGKDELELKPKRRRLKQVLDYVTLQKVTNSIDGTPAVVVEVVDRNNQIVRVESIVQVSFKNLQQLDAQCSEFLGNNGEALCGILAANRLDQPPVP